MQTGWLLRQGEVLAAAEWADTSSERARGLLGRPGYEGALILPRTRSVHSLGMRFSLDVAFLDDELTVLDCVRLDRWRVTLPRRRARSVLEAAAGAFGRWGLAGGDQLEFKGVR